MNREAIYEQALREIKTEATTIRHSWRDVAEARERIKRIAHRALEEGAGR